MKSFKEINDDIQKLFEKSNDKAVIEQAAIVAKDLNDAQDENDKLMHSYTTLHEDYKKSVLTQVFKPNGSQDEKGGSTEPHKTFDQITADVLAADKKEGNK